MKKLLASLGFLMLVLGVILYASGTLRTDRIAPGTAAAPAADAPPARSTHADRIEVPLFERAVGTVRSRMRVTITAQVTGRVLSVGADAGQTVRTGEVLVRLDDRELAAQLGRAKQVLSAAEASLEGARQARTQRAARLDQATSVHQRMQRLREGGVGTVEELEAAKAAHLEAQAALADAEATIAAARARIEQSRETVTAAGVALGHATIHAPLSGVVAERIVEPGDLAWPGRTLLVVLDPAKLRLEARVREGLIARVKHGDALEVEVPAAGTTLAGTVSEIIPSADPETRTFEVRVTIASAPAHVYPGMFGRLRVPVGSREVVRAPAATLLRVGQLEAVTVRDGDHWERRLVTTGAHWDDGAVEILSGLAGGEELGLPEAGAR